jgi:hypothetical protein
MFDAASFGASEMIITSVIRIALALALLLQRAVRNMNCNLMAALAPRAYLVPQRVAGIRRRQGRGFDARGRRT